MDKYRNIFPLLTTQQQLDWISQEGQLSNFSKKLAPFKGTKAYDIWCLADKIAHKTRQEVFSMLNGDDLQILNANCDNNFVIAKIYYWLYEQDSQLLSDGSWLSAFYTEIKSYRKNFEDHTNTQNILVQEMFKVFTEGLSKIKLNDLEDTLSSLDLGKLTSEFEFQLGQISSDRFGHYKFNIASNYIIFYLLLTKRRSQAMNLLQLQDIDLRYYPWCFIHKNLGKSFSVLMDL